jgi:hypothetical protein
MASSKRSSMPSAHTSCAPSLRQICIAERFRLPASRDLANHARTASAKPVGRMRCASF